ncbi:MAG: competence protein CoiA [Cyclobacteriaceae bacterium]|nr:competence protein CoiA [Cyclobacteriaceae bacterium]
MVKYQYAYDQKGQVIFIDDLTKDSLIVNKFKCISCGNEIIARLGRLKTKHFAHKEIVTCSGETYLHQLGKQLFYDEYKKCLTTKTPFTIEYQERQICNARETKFKVSCEFGETTKRFDLTTYFKDIEIEKNYDEFRPDLTLINKDTKEKIFIEIAVTHLSTEKKLESGNRIIELKIKEEPDLIPIKLHHLKKDGERIKFKGFKKSTDKKNHCKGKCRHKFDVFIIKDNSRPQLRQIDLERLEYILSQDKIDHYDISKQTEGFQGDKFRYKIAKAHKNGVKVKNCFICRYHGENTTSDFRENPIVCKFLGIVCNSNEAAVCKFFKVESNYIDGYIANWKELMDMYSMGDGEK